MNGELRALEEAIKAASRDQLPDVVGHLARLEAMARLRLSMVPDAAPSEPKPDIAPTEKLIDAAAAAEMLGMRKERLYELTREGKLPFAYKLGENTRRYSEPGIRRWLRTKRCR